MTQHPVDVATRWAERRREALMAAIAGTHRFVLVDVDAPMGTNEPMGDGTGRVRLSPDVWRTLVPEEPPAWMLPYRPTLPPDEPYVRPYGVMRPILNTLVLLDTIGKSA